MNNNNNNNNKIDSLQKTAILGTSHIIRKVLQCEAWSLSGGDHCWFKRSTGKNRPATRDIIILLLLLLLLLMIIIIRKNWWFWTDQQLKKQAGNQFYRKPKSQATIIRFVQRCQRGSKAVWRILTLQIICMKKTLYISSKITLQL